MEMLRLRGLLLLLLRIRLSRCLRVISLPGGGLVGMRFSGLILGSGGLIHSHVFIWERGGEVGYSSFYSLYYHAYSDVYILTRC